MTDIKVKVKVKVKYTLEDIVNKSELSSDENDTKSIMSNIDIKNMDGQTYLSEIDNNSIDLILTDPPYIISRESGMNSHYNNIKENEEKGIKYVKTEEEWNEYKEKNNIMNLKKIII